MNFFKQTFMWILNFILPPLCPICKKNILEANALCAYCYKKIVLFAEDRFILKRLGKISVAIA